MTRRACLATCLALASGCGLAGGNNDLRPLEVSLASATTLGQSAAIALSAMRGSGEVTCAAITRGCTEYPCEGEVLITYGPGCPLPLGGEAIGVTTVTGTWSTASSAQLDFTFTDVRVGERGTVLAGATTIEASQLEGITTLEYTGSNASVRGGVALAAASVWDVEVNDSGTPGDPSDDSYVVDGSSTAAGGVAGGSIGVEQALITADCRRNPIAGEASVTEGGITNIRTDEIVFLSSCEGTATLEPTLGGPRPVELDFLE